MELTFRIKGLEKMARKVKATTRNAVLIDALTKSAYHIQEWIVENRLSGPRPRYLGRISSRLATSISVVRGERHGNVIIARIGTNVIYAPTHEFGRDQIPARPFLRPGIEDKENRRFVLNMLINRMRLAVKAQL